MSILVLITGALFRDPEERTSSSSGKPFVVATVKATGAENEATEFWSVLAFGETVRTDLMRLKSGDKLSLQGRMKLELYQKAGETRISRSVFADHVLALRQPPKERKPKEKAAPAAGQFPAPAGTSAPRSGDLDDGIPF